MKAHRSVLFILAALLPVNTAVCGQSTAPQPRLEYAEAAASGHGPAIAEARPILQARTADLPGISVAVGLEGRIVWSEGFGWADIEQRVPVTAATKFRVGSVAKPMTAALLALVYEEGKIDLDAPVQSYVPNFPVKKHPITTHQLAGHLAGIRHYRDTEFFSTRRYETVPEGLEIFQDDPLLFEPGEQFHYSSYGWNLISAILEGATGKPFLPQMQERVFDPLGMRSTVADWNHLIIRDRARPYAIDPEGRLANAPYVDNSYKWAGGGFLSNAEDLVRFGQAHLKPGFLKPATLSLLHTSQKTSDGKSTGYGIGWRLAQDPTGPSCNPAHRRLGGRHHAPRHLPRIGTGDRHHLQSYPGAAASGDGGRGRILELAPDIQPDLQHCFRHSQRPCSSAWVPGEPSGRSSPKLNPGSDSNPCQRPRRKWGSLTDDKLSLREWT